MAVVAYFFRFPKNILCSLNCLVDKSQETYETQILCNNLDKNWPCIIYYKEAFWSKESYLTLYAYLATERNENQETYDNISLLMLKQIFA